VKKISLLIILFSIGFMVQAQVEKTILVEHFTNSRCGVCASKNPGLYQNLADNPTVLHIAFHPSSPFSNCIFSQHNPGENDSRTKYYGIFGGTPWIVIQGEVQSPGTNFGNPELFDPFYGQTTAFSIFVKEYRFEEDNVQVEVTIKAVSAHAQEEALLFLGFAEDTVFYEAPNGEDLHHDVFRKALTGIEGDMIPLPANGDSITLMYNVSADAVWDIDRMYTMAILQDPDSKMHLQAAKTSVIEYMDPSFIGSYDRPEELLQVYPNPASGNKITIPDAREDILLFTAAGKLISQYEHKGGQNMTMDITSLQNGIYIVRSGRKSVKLAVTR
jgi:hypothetical protein